MIQYNCKLCGKPHFEHNSVSKSCPMGKKQRVMGYTSYHRDNVYTPNLKKPIKEGFTL